MMVEKMMKKMEEYLYKIETLIRKLMDIIAYN